MDALLQHSIDGFKFENGSGSYCNPRNNLNPGTNHFPSLCQPDSPDQFSPLDSQDQISPVNSPPLPPPLMHLDYAPTLRYISDMLMEEEDLEDQSRLLQDNLALQAAERSFYEVLQDQEQTPPSDQQHSSSPEQNSDDSYDDFPGNLTGLHQTAKSFTGSLVEDFVPYEQSQRRYHHRDEEEIDVEIGRRNKQPAISTSEMEELAEKFEDVLLVCKATQREEANKDKNPPNRTRRVKNSSNKSKTQKSDTVDMRNLLMQCAQAVASFDQRRAAEKLKEVRLHSSCNGDGTQRLAFYFAEALEARMTGTISPLVSTPVPSITTSMVDILKAYKVFVHICPIYVMDYFAANKTIYELALKAKRLHIVDFGILYGFQWPCLIQALSNRPGGPPVLRVTGIELPQPGFRPSERIEETGRRLKRFCDKFHVPFEFNFIAKKWESISLDELMINQEEITVVNCIHRLQYTPDETVSLDSPRDTVLKLFRDIKPDLFVLAEINGMYNSPFFMTRFREALFHFSSLFDMFEATIQGEDEYNIRTLLEKELLVRDVMSVIACEGAERFARPETYKQWQVRILRAGFKPVALNKQIMKGAKEVVRKLYHRDFVIDNDNHWMLQGWKGRVIYALSCWKPAAKLTNSTAIC